jgi:uncharacterized membrane protein
MDYVAYVHIGASVLALVAGALVFVARKGNRLHRRLGWAYTMGMIVLNVSALFLYRLTGAFTPFHIGAIVSLVALSIGVLTLRRAPAPGRVQQHALWLSGSYVGLCGAAAAELTTRVPDQAPFWPTVAITSAVVMLVGGALIGRYAPPALRPFERRSANDTAYGG